MGKYKYCDRSHTLVGYYENGKVTHLKPEEAPEGVVIESAWSDEDEALLLKEADERKERAWRDSEMQRVVSSLDQIKNDREFGGTTYQGNATAKQLNDYRIRLCEYPNQPEFPYGSRPKFSEV
ncbi:hypothetical protein [Salinivibrio sp. KP-1]|uniref:hypothetical protein n=1 Tax=Salinivibrio sp. KP-1 TaxID=1406902 RepID=UPI0006146E30|nr:hypothetical protein [Salinivibrio sp. KP-1]KKA43426.1 hypothetical protein WN56_13640 [Salinivibrio sp. KP-1]